MKPDCLCCGKPEGICSCNIEIQEDNKGNLFSWCATHHRVVLSQDAVSTEHAPQELQGS